MRIFVATICFWKMVLFWCPFKVTKHYKNRGFSRHRGKPRMALLVAKVPFWVFTRKGVLLSVIPKSCALLKTLFYSVFSKRHERMQLEKNKSVAKNRGCLPKCKKVFFGMFFFCFLVVLFFVACVFVLVFCKKAQKGYFPAIFEVFCLFCSPKRPVFKILLFFLICFLFWFSFCLPFENSILSLCFLSISPLL